MVSFWLANNCNQAEQIYSAYQLSLGDHIDSELLVVNQNNYYKCNLNYFTSINKKSRRLILFIIQ